MDPCGPIPDEAVDAWAFAFGEVVDDDARDLIYDIFRWGIMSEHEPEGAALDMIFRAAHAENR